MRRTAGSSAEETESVKRPNMFGSNVEQQTTYGSPPSRICSGTVSVCLIDCLNFDLHTMSFEVNSTLRAAASARMSHKPMGSKVEPRSACCRRVIV
eukprot:6202261-Pleurochrysis_carterae.AAC.1